MIRLFPLTKPAPFRNLLGLPLGGGRGRRGLVSTAPSIPVHLIEKAQTIGESSYGVTRVTLILADGQKVHDVFLAWCTEIVKVGTRSITKREDLDFQIEDIVRIRANGVDS